MEDNNNRDIKTVEFPELTFLKTYQWIDKYFSQLNGVYKICGLKICIDTTRAFVCSVFLGSINIGYISVCTFPIQKGFDSQLNSGEKYLIFSCIKNEHARSLKLHTKLSIKMIYDFIIKNI